jgi:hypothetical protein
MTQELGILALIQRDVRVLTANGDDLTDSTDPSRKMMRQIAGAFHEVDRPLAAAVLGRWDHGLDNPPFGTSQITRITKTAAVRSNAMII